MTVTNRVLRDTVDLRVDKTVTGAVDGYTGSGTDFTVGYTCYLGDPADGFSGSLDIAAGAAAVILVEDVPAGWTCHVVEESPSQGLLQDALLRLGHAGHRRARRRRQRHRQRRPGAPRDEPDRAPDRHLLRGQAARARRPSTARSTTTRRSRAPTPASTPATSCRREPGPSPGRARPPSPRPRTGCRSIDRVFGDGDRTGRRRPGRRLVDLDHRPSSRTRSPSRPWTHPPWSPSPTPRAASTHPSRSPRSTRDRRPRSCRAPRSPAPGRATTRAHRSTPGAGGCPPPAAAVDIALANGTLAGENGAILLPGDLGVHGRGGHPPGRRAGRQLLRLERADLRPGVRDGDPGGHRRERGHRHQLHRPGLRLVPDHQGHRSRRPTGSLDCSSPAPGPAPTPGTPPSPAPGRSTGAGTDQFSGILVGSQCQITEDQPSQSPSTDPSYAWAEQVMTPASITIADDVTPAEITVTNPTVRQLTPLRITKVLVGRHRGRAPGQSLRHVVRLHRRQRRHPPGQPQHRRGTSPGRRTR